jgi:cell division protein FtsX
MMNFWGGTNYYNFSGMRYGAFGLLIPLMVFDLIVRGFALWRSAKKNQNVWFIALLVVNSMGILPLIYLVLNRDQKEAPNKTKKK